MEISKVSTEYQVLLTKKEVHCLLSEYSRLPFKATLMAAMAEMPGVSDITPIYAMSWPNHARFCFTIDRMRDSPEFRNQIAVLVDLHIQNGSNFRCESIEAGRKLAVDA